MSEFEVVSTYTYQEPMETVERCIATVRRLRDNTDFDVMLKGELSYIMDTEPVVLPEEYNTIIHVAKTYKGE